VRVLGVGLRPSKCRVGMSASWFVRRWHCAKPCRASRASRCLSVLQCITVGRASPLLLGTDRRHQLSDRVIYLAHRKHCLPQPLSCQRPAAVFTDCESPLSYRYITANTTLRVHLDSGPKKLWNFEARACVGLQKNLDFINKNVRLD